MIRYLLPLIGAVMLCAEPIVIKESPNRNGYYEIAPQTDQTALRVQSRIRPVDLVKLKLNRESGIGVKTNRYYKNGDPSDEWVSTGSLIVSFSAEKTRDDIEAFAKKWNLSVSKQISKMFHTWLFKNLSEDDDLTLASKIGQAESDISFAKPDFIAKIKLQ
jgi:hypothetical protein